MSTRRFGFRQKSRASDALYQMRPLFGAVPTSIRDVVEWETGPIRNQGSEGACFPPGTLIRMGDGSERRIDELRLLDQVLTAEGNVSTVTQLMVRMDAESVIRLKLRGHGHLRATPEHPILTKRGYVAIKDLVIGDQVAMPRYSSTCVESLDTDQFVPTSRALIRQDRQIRYAGVCGRASTMVTQKAMPKEIPLTKDFGTIAGLFLAEGAASSNRLGWTFSMKERHTLVESLRGLLKSEFGMESSVREKVHSGSCEVRVYGKAWSQLFCALFSTGSHKKRIHPLLMSGPAEFQEAMFEGWLMGDGYRRRTSRQGVTVSHRLAMNMYDIAQSLGKRPTIRRSQPKPSHTVISRMTRWDIEFSQNEGESNHSEMDESHVWRKVQGLEMEDYEGPVYNIEVEGDHSYVAEGIGVHNCVGFGCKALLEAAPFKQTGEPTAREIYLQARIIDEFDDDEVQEGTSVRAGLDVLRSLGLIRNYVWASNVEDVYQFLDKKGPVVAGVSWHGYFTDLDGRMRFDGPEVGGHSITFTGYDRTTRRFKFQNSWGTEFGARGFGYVTEADLSRELTKRYGVCAGIVEAIAA